jgi:hypothetical protein
LPDQPRLGHIPVPFDGRGRNVQHCRNLFRCQPAEKAQFDDTSLLLVETREIVQRVIQGNQVDTPRLRQHDRSVEFDQPVSAALGRAMGAGLVHEDLAHQA